jgi:hypothetical protein
MRLKENEVGAWIQVLGRGDEYGDAVDLRQ